MGLTAHNRKRRELEAKGQGNLVTKAQAHYDAAEKRLIDLVDKTAVAEEHLEEMGKALEAAKKAQAEQTKATKAKAVKAAKTVKAKPVPKKGK